MQTSFPLSVLTISGSDATTFLQGQLTNDISALNNPANSAYTAHQWTALCNPKGRAIATMIAFPNQQASGEETSIHLLMRSDSIEHVHTHLQKFVFRSKVRFDHQSYNISASEKPQAELSATKDTSALQLTDSLGLAVSTNDTTPEGWQNLTQSWLNGLIVKHGLPLVGESLREALIPNHIDFEAWSGISYKKGCYTGQEVIARLHYLGKSKSALYQHSSPVDADTADTDKTAIIGEDIVFAPDKFQQQPVGSVLAVSVKEDTNDGLTYIDRLISLKTSADAYKLAFNSPDNLAEAGVLSRVFSE